MRRSSLARISPALLLGVLSYLLAVPWPAAPRETAGAVSDRKIERLVGDLGSNSFEVREAAMRALIELENEPPGLHKALKSPDPEVRRRVDRILEAHVQKRAARGLAKTQALGREGRVDEMIERLVVWKERDKGQGWKALTELAARLVERTERTFGSKTHFQNRIKPAKAGSPSGAIAPKNLAEFWQIDSKLVREDEIPLDPRDCFKTSVGPGV